MSSATNIWLSRGLHVFFELLLQYNRGCPGCQHRGDLSGDGGSYPKVPLTWSSVSGLSDRVFCSMQDTGANRGRTDARGMYLHYQPYYFTCPAYMRFRHAGLHLTVRRCRSFPCITVHAMEPDDHTRGALDMRHDDGRGGWPGVFLRRYRCVGVSIWFVSQFVCGTNCTC